MKKYLVFFVPVAVLVAPFSAFAAMTIVPPSPQTIGTFTTLDITCDTGDVVVSYDGSGNEIGGSDAGCSNPTYPASSYFSVPATYTLVECLSSLSLDSCRASTLVAAESDPGFISESSFQVDPVPPAPPPLNAIIASSSVLFAATAGIDYADLVSWVGGILQTVLGGGLGLVYATIGWIIAIIIITVIVRLLYHGLKWLHIVR